MGEVYLALDARLGRKVALKLLPAAYTADETRMRRFVQEAKAASALNHPNILTVHEIGENNGLHFIITEFVDGTVLRQQMVRARLSLRLALDVAIQVASALTAAHAAGIVHRDIKPENIMIRRDGVVKVLDFGLAKLVEQSGTSDGDVATIAAGKTGPGVVVGTARYMSPEQARGGDVDARSDIFSLGSVLYEMLAGRPPFDGDTPSDVMAAILKTEPPGVDHYLPNAPRELRHIVAKSLRKDREDRYQSVKDLLIDLKDLKQDLEFEARLEKSSPPAYRGTAVSVGREAASGPALESPAVPGSGAAVGRTSSSAEYIVNGLKRHKRAALITGIVFAVGAVALFSYLNRAAALTEKDTILLADFVNTTGDPVFDGTLKQGLAVQLQQSPFLNLFPEARVRATLRLMGRSPDARVTTEIAREICQRHGLKALIAGSIAPLGSHYVTALEAINAQTGEVMAREQVESENKEQVLRALSRAATQLREQLGESLSSIQKFDAPLEEATTSSLEALKAYSLAIQQSLRGDWLESAPSHERAVGLDPNFALAHVGLAVAYGNTNQPARAARSAEKAFALRERVSEYERLRITFFYYASVTGELDKSIEVQQLLKRTYPREHRGPGNLSDRYLMTGQFEEVISEAREALRLNPDTAAWYKNLGEAFIRLDRFAEAKKTYERALEQKLDNIRLRTGLFEIAFVNGDYATMQQQLDWARGKPDEYVATEWQTQRAAFGGQWRRSQDFSRRAIDLAARSDAKGVAAQYAAEQSLRSAVLDQCAPARTATSQALELERNQGSLPRAALALALCGQADQAQRLIDELNERFPKDTLINSLWLPTIRVALELKRNNPAQALELLEAASRYERAAQFWPTYLRAQASLRQQKGAEAAAEFQKILDHRGWAPLSALYPLAHLGLARAAALTGESATCRKAYQDFLALWKDADSDLAPLIAARKEYDRVVRADTDVTR
jgi:tetratricopeptide (TPR) repeat protein